MLRFSALPWAQGHVCLLVRIRSVAGLRNIYNHAYVAPAGSQVHQNKSMLRWLLLIDCVEPHVLTMFFRNVLSIMIFVSGVSRAVDG